MGSDQKAAARELLQALFTEEPQHGEKRQEWLCKDCGCSNYMSRAACRKCPKFATQATATPRRDTASGAGKTTRPSSPPSPSPSSAPAWKRMEELSKQKASAEAALAAATAQDGDKELIQILQVRLEKIVKSMAVPKQSLAERIAGTRGFIERQQKRVQAQEQEIVKANVELECLQATLKEHRDQLARMEAEATAELIPQGGSTNLEEAVRMLMVTMHTCQQLPPQVAEAATAVVQLLPNHEPSRDGEDMAVDGNQAAEADIPAGQVDAPLPTDTRESVEKCHWKEAWAEISDIDLDADSELLAWAKSVKSRSRTQPY